MFGTFFMIIHNKTKKCNFYTFSDFPILENTKPPSETAVRQAIGKQ